MEEQEMFPELPLNSVKHYTAFLMRFL